MTADESIQEDAQMHESMEEEGSESEKDSQQDESVEDPEEASNIDADETDFTKVKLASKHAAFIKQSSEGKCLLHFATQNQRAQMAVEKQKIEVPSNYADGLKHIISSYPEYCEFEDLPGMDDSLPDFLK